MTITTTLLGVVALVNVLGGALVALLVLKSQETIPQIAPIPGIALGGGAIYGQMVVGDMLDPTVPEMKALVLTAVVSALIGLLGVFSTLEAESGNR